MDILPGFLFVFSVEVRNDPQDLNFMAVEKLIYNFQIASRYAQYAPEGFGEWGAGVVVAWF